MNKHEDALAEAQSLGLRWGRPDGRIVSRAEVVAAAREWVGTPFIHQARLKGVGVDCGGLIVAVSVELGLLPANYQSLIPTKIRGYGRDPDGDLGVLLCDHYLKRIDPAEVRPGDVVLVRWEGPPRHAAFVGEASYGLTMIHAESRVAMKVVEHTIRMISGSGSRAPKLAYAYALPGVE